VHSAQRGMCVVATIEQEKQSMIPFYLVVLLDHCKVVLHVEYDNFEDSSKDMTINLNEKYFVYFLASGETLVRNVVTILELEKQKSEDVEEPIHVKT